MTPGVHDVDGAVADQLPELLATAMALTGAVGAAADVVGEVMVLARRPRSGVDLIDPGPGLRNLLVNRYGAQRRVGAAGPRRLEDPAEPQPEQPEQPEQPGEPDEIEEIIAGLDRLTRPQRAALLLSFRDRLTYAEIAGILDRPVGKVAHSVADAQTQLDATPYAITAAFERLGRRAPDPAQARAAKVRFGQRLGRRRRRVSVLVAAAVVLVALAVAVPTVILPWLHPIPVRAAGDWAYGYRVEAPAGFQVSQRFLERDKDSTYLVEGPNEAAGCTIEAYVDRPTAPASSGGTSVKVNGRPGRIYQSEEMDGKALTWLYAPGAEATVSCGERTDPEQLLQQIAANITFTTVPLILPFRLAAPPEGYEVTAVGALAELSTGEPGPGSALLLSPIGAGVESEDSIFVMMPADRPEGDQVETVSVNGTKAFLETQDDVVSLCLPEQQLIACLTASSTTAVSGTSAPDLDVRRLVDLATALSFASDLTDRATWFDAREALPH